MTTYRVRPTKPVAAVGVVLGVAVLVSGIVMLATRRGDVPLPLLVVWLVFGAALTLFSVWTAFARNGRTQTLHIAEDVPHDRLATDVETS